MIVFSLMTPFLNLECAEANETGISSLITLKSVSKTESSGGGSSKSNSRSSVIEKIIDERDGELTLEYAFPESRIPEIEAWKLPAKVVIRKDEPPILINSVEIESRLLSFLDQNPEVRELCGQTIFTWTAVNIHCKADHVLDVIDMYNLHIGNLASGRAYSEAGALQAVPLKLVSSVGVGTKYIANLTLDPEYLRETYETKVKQVAAITGRSFEETISSLLKLTDGDTPSFSGNRIVTIETSSTGKIVRIKRDTVSTIVGGSNFTHTTSVSQVVESHPIK